MTAKTIRMDGYYPAAAQARQALRTKWDTLEELLPVVTRYIHRAHASGLTVGMIRGARAANGEAKRRGRTSRPLPIEACAAYMHGAEVNACHLHNWANLVARAGVAVGKKRGAIIDGAMAESILAVEALLHSLLSRSTQGEAA
jgi:hypothetical protein